MRKAEFEARVLAYGRRLGARDSSALRIVSALVFALPISAFLLQRRISREAYGVIIVSLLVALFLAAMWVLARAWLRDRAEGVVAPCPSCGRELVMLYDEVMEAGICPYCRDRALSDAA